MLEEGDVIQIEPGMRVYADVPQHFLYSNRRGDFTPGHGEIRIFGDLSYFAGKYVVLKTSFDGGGSGHGPGDSYPNGHHVFCESTEAPKRKIDFYQSGCFTCMLPDLKAIGKAELKWVLSQEVQGG
jgi:hypothetical protein